MLLCSRLMKNISSPKMTGKKMTSPSYDPCEEPNMLIPCTVPCGHCGVPCMPWLCQTCQKPEPTEMPEDPCQDPDPSNKRSNRTQAPTQSPSSPGSKRSKQRAAETAAQSTTQASGSGIQQMHRSIAAAAETAACSGEAAQRLAAASNRCKIAVARYKQAVHHMDSINNTGNL